MDKDHCSVVERMLGVQGVVGSNLESPVSHQVAGDVKDYVLDETLVSCRQFELTVWI